jgi:diaminohydroxyphosphoribosylaminopyrimidine deaminase/5-amino-6-(5-phosphoribosylamino)uracil reductase
MMSSENSADIRYMRRALALAKQGTGKTAPNPLVGCVIVNNGKIVGEGYHEYFGGPHAEVNALAAAGRRAAGATLYVTLEPCNHWGKTPPCADAIIEAGISKVVAPIADPNPRTRGDGFRKIKTHGISVVTGIMKAEASRLNSRYIASAGRKRPHRVIIKAATTLDGKIATRTGDSKWITGRMARDYVHRFRAGLDGILVGIHTVITDDPELTAHGEGTDPVRIIIDPRLKIPLQSRVLDCQAATVIFHAEGLRSSKLAALRDKKVMTVPLPAVHGRMDFKEIIERLAQMSLCRIMIEGGGETIAAALEAGVVDEALFFINPRIAGGRDARTAVEGTGAALIDDAVRLTNVRTRKLGPDLLISGELKY